MARAFAKIAFTPKVQAAQTRMGSRAAYRGAEQGEVAAHGCGIHGEEGKDVHQGHQKKCCE